VGGAARTERTDLVHRRNHGRGGAHLRHSPVVPDERPPLRRRDLRGRAERQLAHEPPARLDLPTPGRRDDAAAPGPRSGRRASDQNPTGPVIPTLKMERPTLRFWQMFNMSFGFLGIQFGWGLQLANMSAVYERLGARSDQVPLLWLAAPLTGLVVQPIVGALSDRTWGRLGRRRPYFLTGAILASLALFVMPTSSALWMAATLLWILDASIRELPAPMRQLAVVQLFPWLGLFCMWLFFVPATARHVFGATDPQSARYTQGIEWGGFTFAFYSITCFLVALALPRLAQWTS